MNHSGVTRRGLLKWTGAVAALATVRAPAVRAAQGSTARLFFTEGGAGEPLMLLHGWTCDSNDWSWQLPVFTSKYRVVAVDLRGHGWSEVMPSGGYRPEAYVRDIEALIEGRFGGRKFIVMGHSMGGQIAARLAAKRPDLVKAVVSVDGSLGFSNQVGEQFAKVTRALDTQGPDRVVPALFEQVYAKATAPAFKSWHARRMKGMSRIAVVESFGPLFVGTNQVGVGSASARFCSGLKMPVYHLCRDPAQARRMRPWFANDKSKVDVWRRTGHWIMQDRPHDLNRAVTAWMDSL